MGRRKRRTNRLLKKTPVGTNTKRHNAAESTTDRKSSTNWNAQAAYTVSANTEEVAKLPNCEFAAAANSYCFAEIHAIIREIEEKSQEYDRVHRLTRDNCDAEINSSSTEIIPSSNEHANYFLQGCNIQDAGPPVLQSRKNFPHPFKRGESSKKMVGDGCISNNRTSSFGSIPESNAVLYPIQRHCTEGLRVPFLLDGVSCMGAVVGAANGEALISKECFHNYINDKDLEGSKKPHELSENISADIKSGELMQEVENGELVSMSNNSAHDLKGDSENSSLSSLDIVSKTQEINSLPTDIDVDEIVDIIKRDWKITTDAESIAHPPPVNINKGNRETPKTTGSVKIPRVRIFPDSQSEDVTYIPRSNLPGILKDDISTDERRNIHVSANHSETMALRFPHEWPKAQPEEIDANDHSGEKRNNKTSDTSISKGMPQNSHCFNENVNIDMPVFNFLDLPEEPGSISPGTRELLGILSTTSVDLLIPSLS